MFLSYSGRILQLRTVITAETTSSVSGDNCRVNSRNTVFRLQSNPAGMCDWPPCWIWRCRWTCISWPESSALAPVSNDRRRAFLLFFFSRRAKVGLNEAFGEESSKNGHDSLGKTGLGWEEVLVKFFGSDTSLVMWNDTGPKIHPICFI